MLFDEALSYLLSLGHETLTIKLGLSNTEILLAALGNPHRHFPSVQIAGTNGKGSTAVMLESICRVAGIRTGLFTSPHLTSITERIEINGLDVTQSEFGRLTEQVKKAAEALVVSGDLETLPTFFEHITAIALLAFREAEVELAILETGLGGRLDSTTAAGAQIVAITPISLDHQEFLGETLSQIAAEKAAIIRPGVTAVVAPQSKDAFEVIARRCQSAGVQARPIAEAEILKTSDNGTINASFETPGHRYENVTVGLRGRHQIMNAATAIALAEALREKQFEIPDEAIILGLSNVRHPGRLEFHPGRPPILLDGAHNPAAARTLRDYLDEFAQMPITMIFGAMRDKAVTEMAEILFPAASELILTAIDNPRAAAPDMLQSLLPDNLDCRVHQAKSVSEALDLAFRITPPKGLVCITGSLYLIGEARERLMILRLVACDKLIQQPEREEGV